VNANPSGSRTPSTGGRGESQSRKGLARTTGPLLGQAQIRLCPLNFRVACRGANGFSGGTRRAKMACRGAHCVRLAGQGRAGDVTPRQVYFHLAPQPLLSANTPALAGAVRLFRLNLESPGNKAEIATAAFGVTRQEAQQGKCASPRDGASVTELVQPGRSARFHAADGHPPRKGVLAA
jgi:hypothetical protein